MKVQQSFDSSPSTKPSATSPLSASSTTAKHQPSQLNPPTPTTTATTTRKQASNQSPKNSTNTILLRSQAQSSPPSLRSSIRWKLLSSLSSERLDRKVPKSFRMKAGSARTQSRNVSVKSQKLEWGYTWFGFVVNTCQEGGKRVVLLKDVSSIKLFKSAVSLLNRRW